MALRVLLADESSTIKKVFQLALQDFAVDVRAVSLGLDVVPVARQFKPDIIFCDILLPKKSGYDVASEVKQDAELNSIPIVIMWSGFMELDPDKFQASRADGQLEKPFEVDDLRKLIHQFVPRTRNQKLSEFLSFPKMPEMIEAKGAPPAEPSNWNMESFDPIPSLVSTENDEFKEMPLPPPPKSNELESLDAAEDESTQWSARPLKKFKVDIPPEEQEHVAVDLREEEDLAIETNVKARQIQPPAPQPKAKTPAASLAQPSPEQIEKIIREQSRALIESVVWKVVPDLATQIIERELKRLLAEKGSSATP